jgi:hypothetical protein
MAKGRKPDHEQLHLSQDHDVVAREDDKRRIRLVKLHHVVAWCNSQGITPPTNRQWQNVQEVLTFLRHCEWAMQEIRRPRKSPAAAPNAAAR